MGVKHFDGREEGDLVTPLDQPDSKIHVFCEIAAKSIFFKHLLFNEAGDVAEVAAFPEGTEVRSSQLGDSVSVATFQETLARMNQKIVKKIRVAPGEFHAGSCDNAPFGRVLDRLYHRVNP